jgi:hypothetical protein
VVRCSSPTTNRTARINQYSLDFLLPAASRREWAVQDKTTICDANSFFFVCLPAYVHSTPVSKQKKTAHSHWFFLRSEAGSNRCRSFCRALPNHSAIRPLFKGGAKLVFL